MKNFSRRSFLATGAAAVGSVTLGRSLMHADEDPVAKSIERFAGFKMGLQSYSLRHFEFEQTIEHLNTLGLHYIEYYPRHLPVDTDADQAAALKAKFAEHHIHLPIHGVHGFGGNADVNRRLFEFAKMMGIPLLSAHPHKESFPILHDLVQEFDIRIGIHNHGPNHMFDRIEDSLNAVADYDKRIGFCPDTGHCMRSGEDPVEMVRLMKDRLYGMHLKDQREISRNNPPETILGEGALDLEGFVKTLREIGYDEPISLEYELNPRDPIADIQKGLENFAKVAHATKPA